MECGAAIRPVNRRCTRCADNQAEEPDGEERRNVDVIMRPIPHRANAAYYSHHITRVNVSRQDVQVLLDHPEKKRILVDAYLNNVYRTEDLLRGVTGDSGGSDADRMRRRAAALPEGPEKQKLLEAAMVLAALDLRSGSAVESAAAHELSDAATEELFDYVKLRGACNISGLDDVRRTVEQKRPGMGRMFDRIQQEHQLAGLSEIALITDFPIATTVFGYTRVSPDPETAIGDRRIHTTFRRFPTFRMSGDSLQDKIPVFCRVAETEGLLVRIDPVRLLAWVDRMCPGSIGEVPADESEAKLRLLGCVGDVDRFVTPAGMSEITRTIFGLVHTASHALIRAAASLAGVERAGFGEYLFPRIGTFVIYNANTEFNLGGLTTLFEEELEILLARARYDPLARECVYDPVCREQHHSSCHACTHLGEMACAYFNRAMSRQFLFGPQGFWGE
jgi:hypothetical protein